MSKPNIVWIIPDDTNHKMLGYGGGKVLSPNLDSIARNGVALDQFHCSAPACGPSRYTYLTGHYGGRCPTDEFRGRCEASGEPYRLFFNASLDPAKEQSLGHALQGAGYRTGHVGKWHVDAGPEDEAALPHFDPDDDPRDATVGARMASHQHKLCEIVRKAGFDFAHSVIWGNHQTLPRKAQNHNIEWITKGALDFIDQSTQDDRPFFLSMATTTIHGPNHVASLLADPHLTAAGYSDDHIGCQASRQSIYERICAADGVKFNSTTAGVLWMDDAVGAVLARLRGLGIEGNTIVIFSGDHGPSLGGKFTTYQRGMRIPFIAQWPGRIPAGRVVRDLTQNIDFLPTLLDAAGAEAPEGMVLDGRSLLPLLTGAQDALPDRDDLYFEFGYTRSVRTRRWKYIAWRLPRPMLDDLQSGETKALCTHYGLELPAETVRPSLITASLLNYPHYFDADQLYDLENDPCERTNLAGEEAYASVLSDMKERLGKYVDTFDRPFPLSEVDGFYSSERFEELKRHVARRVQAEAAEWRQDTAHIGFADAATDMPTLYGDTR